MQPFKNSTEWQWIPIKAVKPYARHPRNHNKRGIEKIKKIIAYYGQLVPIIVDPSHVIIDGHAVWQAMNELGSGDIAVVVVAGRSDPEIKALRLALNRIPSDAAWDNERVRQELRELVNLSFDLELTGFDAPEIDHILDVDLQKLNVIDANIPAVAKIAVSAAADIWVCCDHRVGCGDARDQTFVDRVREGSSTSTISASSSTRLPRAKTNVSPSICRQGVSKLSLQPSIYRHGFSPTIRLRRSWS